MQLSPLILHISCSTTFASIAQAPALNTPVAPQKQSHFKKNNNLSPLFPRHALPRTAFCIQKSAQAHSLRRFAKTRKVKP